MIFEALTIKAQEEPLGKEPACIRGKNLYQELQKITGVRALCSELVLHK
jgi:hypothetical protein